MKRILLTLLAAIFMLGLFAAAGYAGYRIGYAQAAQDVVAQADGRFGTVVQLEIVLDLARLAAAGGGAILPGGESRGTQPGRSRAGAAVGGFAAPRHTPSTSTPALARTRRARVSRCSLRSGLRLWGMVMLPTESVVVGSRSSPISTCRARAPV